MSLFRADSPNHIFIIYFFILNYMLIQIYGVKKTMNTYLMNYERNLQILQHFI